MSRFDDALTDVGMSHFTTTMDLYDNLKLKNNSSAKTLRSVIVQEAKTSGLSWSKHPTRTANRFVISFT